MKPIRRTNSWPIGFNMTPMIDVIFQLIIFFLAVNQFEKAETDREVVLPEASKENVETRPEEPKSRVIINVPDEGPVTVAGQALLEDRIPLFLAEQQAKTTPGNLEVWIRCDRTVVYGRVEKILLACAEVGIWKIAFKVVTKEGP